MSDYRDIIKKSLHSCLTETDFSFGKRYRGKVRDTYDCGDELVLVTTDRLSAFDRILASVPFKGQVLNEASIWWFEKTKSIIDNHVIAVPHPNVVVAKKCKVLPIEFVVRGYITGATNTALWTQYHDGVRHYCGIDFPDGLRKNQKLSSPVLTPTTKESTHDRPLSPKEIVAEGWLSEDDWLEASQKALMLFNFGTKVAADHGLILVDTKYEFGKDAKGNIILIDEIHTPDSSRYWLKSTYHSRFDQGLEPDNIDKEFLRLWFKEHSDPYHDTALPKAPDELIIELSSRYIQLYETITGKTFVPETGDMVHKINDNIERYFKTRQNKKTTD